MDLRTRIHKKKLKIMIRKVGKSPCFEAATFKEARDFSRRDLLRKTTQGERTEISFRLWFSFTIFWIFCSKSSGKFCSKGERNICTFHCFDCLCLQQRKLFLDLRSGVSTKVIGVKSKSNEWNDIFYLEFTSICLSSTKACFTDQVHPNSHGQINEINFQSIEFQMFLWSLYHAPWNWK